MKCPKCSGDVFTNQFVLHYSYVQFCLNKACDYEKTGRKVKGAAHEPS